MLRWPCKPWGGAIDESDEAFARWFHAQRATPEQAIHAATGELQDAYAGFGAWAAALPATERQALTLWSGQATPGGYERIQAYLAGERGPEVDTITERGTLSRIPTAQVVAAMQSALTQGRAPQDYVTLRGGDVREVADWTVGEVRETSRFLATTANRSWMERMFLGSARITVRIPKGAKVGLVDAAVDGHSESELLLPMGTRFRVNSISERPAFPGSNNLQTMIRDVEIEVLP